MWLEGKPVWAIAARVDSTSKAIGVAMVHMRRDGWALPLRPHKDRVPLGDVQRGTRDQAALSRNRASNRARDQLHRAIKRGDVERPDSCAACGGSDRIEGHHADYSKPLDVEWLCFSCHRQRHGRTLDIAA